MDPRPVGGGEQLAPLWYGARPPAPPAFAEATKPLEREHPTAWNNLPFERSVILDGRFVVKNPWRDQAPQIYQMAPGQPATQDPAALYRLDGLLSGWDAAAPAHQTATMSSETEAALRSLGYLDDLEEDPSEASE